MTPEPLRIVYLIGQLGLGGSERQLYLLLKNMNAKCFERHVVVFNPSSHYTLDDDLRRAGVNVYTLPPECKGIGRRIIWLYRLLRQVRPHLLHAWSIHDNAYAGVVGALARVPRRLGSVRGALSSSNFRQFAPLIRWLILHSVHGHLVNSPAIANELLAFGIPRKRIRVMPNCVELSPSQKPVSFEGAPAAARLVGMVANLRREKNHILFVRGLAQVLPEFPDVYGVIVGQPILNYDPEVPGLIRAEIETQGVQGRVLLGGFHANVPALLPSFEIFCLTSNSEGTPNAILEAMAAGLPVIATRVGGIPFIVQDGVTGLLIEPDDVSGLAGALRTLFRQPEKARQMGTAGQERVRKEYACQTLIHEFEQYYLSQFPA